MNSLHALYTFTQHLMMMMMMMMMMMYTCIVTPCSVRSVVLNLLSVTCMVSCFRNPPNSDMDYRISIVCT